MKRRSFLKSLPLGFGAALTIPTFAGKADAILRSKLLEALSNPLAETDRVLVIIFLAGGNDGINTLIPFQNPTYDRVRKNTGFTTTEEKARLKDKLSDTLAFNPYMEKLVPLWKENKIAVVQNVGLANPDLSHFRATDIWNSACDEDQLLSTGWVGRWFDLEFQDYPDSKPKDPLAISIGSSTSALFQGKRCAVDLLVNDPSSYAPVGMLPNQPLPDTYGGKELHFVRDLLSVSDFYAQRFEELFPANAKNAVEYPDSTLANDLKKIAWCIASGMKTRIYFTEHDGYDTHFNQHSKDDVQSDGHGILLKQFSEAVAAFQRDLEAMGLDDRVLTMTYSEFGRRVAENGDYSSGTDHGTSAPHFLIGTHANGGLYGKDPDLDNVDGNGNLLNEFEFRQMYASVMGDWFGVSEQTRQIVLSPDRDRAPFETVFPLNADRTKKQSLINQSVVQRGVKKASLPTQAQLIGNYPNPATSFTVVQFKLAETMPVKLEVFDQRGTLLQQPLNSSLGRGLHEISLDTHALISGSYIYRLTAGTAQFTKQLQVVR